MDSAGCTSPQAVLAKASSLVDAIQTKEGYDQAVQQRGLDVVEAEITAVMADICQLMASSSPLRLDAMLQLNRLLPIKHIDRFAKAIGVGVLPAAVEQLSGRHEMESGAAAWLLGMLAVNHAAAVADAGAVPPLVQLVSSRTDRVCKGAMGALRMIMAGSVDRRDAVVAAGVLQPLLTVVREAASTEVMAVGLCLLCDVWAVTESPPLPAPLAEFAPFLPVLVSLIAAPQQDDGVLEPARVALAHFATWCDEQDGTDGDRDALVECGAVGSLKTMAAVGAGRGAHEVAGLIVIFIAAGSPAHVQAVIDGDLVPLLISMAVSEESHPQVKVIAAGAVGNVAHGSQQQAEYVVECGGVQPLCDALGDDNDNRENTIKALDNILRAGRQKQANEGLPDNPYSTLVDQAGGVDKVVELQTHEDVDIAVPAVMLVADHYPDRVDPQGLQALMQAAAEEGGDDEDGESDVDTDVSEDDSRSGGEGEGEGAGGEA